MGGLRDSVLLYADAAALMRAALRAAPAQSAATSPPVSQRSFHLAARTNYP